MGGLPGCRGRGPGASGADFGRFRQRRQTGLSEGIRILQSEAAPVAALALTGLTDWLGGELVGFAIRPGGVHAAERLRAVDQRLRGRRNVCCEQGD